jgi:hypothetical protein
MAPDVRLFFEQNGYTRTARKETHWSMRMLWTAAVVFVTTYFTNERPDDEITGLLVLWWSLLGVVIIAVCVFLRNFWVPKRFTLVLHSLTSWQMFVLCLIHAIVSMTFADPSYSHQVVPANLCLFIGGMFPVIMDATEASHWESSVQFAMLVSMALLGFIANLFMFVDYPVFDGFPRSNMTHENTGSYTKNELRRSCLMSVFALVLKRCQDSFQDRQQRYVYFSRQYRLLAGAERRRWQVLAIMMRLVGHFAVQAKKRISDLPNTPIELRRSLVGTEPLDFEAIPTKLTK